MIFCADILEKYGISMLATCSRPRKALAACSRRHIKSGLMRKRAKGGPVFYCELAVRLVGPAIKTVPQLARYCRARPGIPGPKFTAGPQHSC